MSFLRLPIFYTPNPERIFTTDEEIKTHTHPLSYCSSCGYVLGNDGCCDNDECSEPDTDDQREQGGWY